MSGEWSEAEVTENKKDIRDIMPLLSSSLDVDSYLDMLRPGLGNDPGERLDPEAREVYLGGGSYKYLTEHYDYYGITMIQYYVARRIDDQMLIMIFTGEKDDPIDRFAAMFHTED